MPRSNKVGQSDAGDVLAGRDQGDRRAAPAIEPAADIDQQRGIDAAIAQQADHQSLADIERPDRTQRGKRQAAGHHAGADGDGGCERRCGPPASPSGRRRRRCRSRPARRPVPATDRSVPSASCIGFMPTTMSRGEPKEIDRMARVSPGGFPRCAAFDAAALDARCRRSRLRPFCCGFLRRHYAKRRWATPLPSGGDFRPA